LNYKLKYSPDAREKLRDIKVQVTASYGSEVATKVISEIMGDIKGLVDNPKKGPSVESLIGIPTNYRFLHIKQNYAFYRIENNTIYVTGIYNEREDFMRRMFGISLRTQDSIDFWGE